MTTVAPPSGTEALIREAIDALARAMLCEECGSRPRRGQCRTCSKTREQWMDIDGPGNMAKRHIKARVSPRRPGPWWNSAECRGMDPEIFFPAVGQHISTAALAACARCPVRDECREYAIANREKGVWGGTSEDERNPRKAAASPPKGRRAA